MTIAGISKLHLNYSNNHSQVTPNTERIGQPAILRQRRFIFNGFLASAIVLAILRAKMYRFSGFRRGVGAAERAGFENQCALY